MNIEPENSGTELAPADISDIQNTQIGQEPAEQKAPKKKLPKLCKVLYVIAACCAVLYCLFLLFPPLADFFNKYISPILRMVLAKLTELIPFSLAELFILLIPLAVIVLTVYGMKHYSDSWRNIGVYCLILLSIGAYVFSTFTIGFVPAYRGSRLDVKMGIEKGEVSAEELLATAQILRQNIDREIGGIRFSSSGASVMPYGLEELTQKLMEAYDTASDKYDFIDHFSTRVKPIMLSEPMTYTHISGVYTFFTGEANLNTNFPDYSLPYTAAHELAHQRGFAREDEANFIAFLVCIQSNDAYIRYSGYLNLYESVANALYRANPDYYMAFIQTMPINARREMSAYSKFFDKYRESVASNISGAVNNAFLTVNGTEGTASYGMVVDLAVAYFKSQD